MVISLTLEGLIKEALQAFTDMCEAVTEHENLMAAAEKKRQEKEES